MKALVLLDLASNEQACEAVFLSFLTPCQQKEILGADTFFICIYSVRHHRLF